MPSFITKYSEITPAELGVLNRQFEQSHFFQHLSTTTPKKLAIFDFDSTLFFSPLLSPTLWHPDLINIATSENVYGPGWWRDVRSLDLGPIEQLQKTAWEGFWNEKIVQEARDCIKDPQVMTVVLTGRRYHPFHQLIPYMLESKDLKFDLIGLRPDPESVADNHWEERKAKVTYHLTDSVFHSTMHFKTCFILNILHRVSSIQGVVMWDDRIPHVKRFKEYLEALEQSDTIKSREVIHVPGIRPKYNPEWERNVMTHITETHNQTLMELCKGRRNGKLEQRMSWNKPEKPLIVGSDKILQLALAPAQTILALSPETISKLQESYKTLYANQARDNRRSKWKYYGGEEPVFFGDNVYLAQSVIPSDNISAGPIGTQVGMTVTAYSVSPRLNCFLLQVKIDGDNETKYLLPLWYKPSEFHDIFRLHDIYWKSIRPTDTKLLQTMTGTVNYAFRTNFIKASPLKRPNEDSVDQQQNNHRRRL